MSKIAIVGAGPAGIAAAIQLARSGREVQVFEPGTIGGTLWNAGWVENYPGFPGGITGRHLAQLMEEQLYQHIDSIIQDKVDTIRKTEAGYEISGENYHGVIVCTGTVSKKAGFSGEEELEKAGRLFYGINLGIWHGPREVGIIGGGEASVDMALSLAEAGMKPTVIHRSKPRGIKSLMDQALDEPDITWKEGIVTGARLHGEKAVIMLENEELAFDLVIVAVGRKKTLPELVGIDIDNLPEGFFAAGDAARGTLGQATMAVGDGVEAAMQMGRYLEARK